VAAAIAGPNAALFWTGVERLKRDFGISGNSLVTFMCNGVAVAIAGPNAALFWASLKRLKDEFGISDNNLVTFMGNSVAAAIKGPKAALFWTGLSRLNDKLTSCGTMRIMCDGVASHTSSPEWVDAVLGVLHLTSAVCVRALVHKSPTVAMAGAVHAHLQTCNSSEHKHFERGVCVGDFQRKRERVRKWLSDE